MNSTVDANGGEVAHLGYTATADVSAIMASCSWCCPHDFDASNTCSLTSIDFSQLVPHSWVVHVSGRPT